MTYQNQGINTNSQTKLNLYVNKTDNIYFNTFEKVPGTTHDQQIMTKFFVFGNQISEIKSPFPNLTKDNERKYWGEKRDK